MNHYLCLTDYEKNLIDSALLILMKKTSNIAINQQKTQCSNTIKILISHFLSYVQK